MFVRNSTFETHARVELVLPEGRSALRLWAHPLSRNLGFQSAFWALEIESHTTTTRLPGKFHLDLEKRTGQKTQRPLCLLSARREGSNLSLAFRQCQPP
jgi:hypothetical protein